ncbi:CDP-glycerol glycerophosphotransferase family protein [Barrientosiimonas marina]|uniref:CDP-glycerol glycerophosphotransferase family protein n=1 Tax=Lentibacillus kimchii TaxID=1542911 RepID=A0ABW2UXB7_9BACI
MKWHKILKKWKQRLVKKVTLYDWSGDSDALTYYFQLSHFWGDINHVAAALTTDDHAYFLPCERQGKHLTITVSADNLNVIESSAVLHVYINHQVMWLTTSLSNSAMKEAVITGGKCLVTKVQQHLTIRRLLPEYDFNREPITIRDVQTGYNTLSFQMTDWHDTPMELCFLRGQKDMLLQATVDEGCVQVHDLSLLSKGNWQLFIKTGNTLTPAGIQEQEMAFFNTCHHRMTPLSKKGYFHLHVAPNRLKAASIGIEHQSASISLHITPEAIEQQADANLQLIMNDPVHDRDYIYSLHPETQGYLAHIPLMDVNDHFAKKRFFVLQEGDEPLKYQLQIKRSVLKGDLTFEHAVNAQYMTYAFYKRKDATLGLNVQKPKLNKQLWKIDDFILKGQLGEGDGALDKFMDCAPYLYIEDRHSFDAVYMPIQDVFEADLNELDLINLKSKEKTIFDIFVVIINQQGDMIRKEKIKYKYADYKKDNYYTYKQQEDDASNQHHFLITTTPFGNLKIESFTIPRTIQIPADTSVKDSNVWLLGERYNTAQDNGIVLFHWLQNHTDIDAYYVIDEESPEYEKMKDNPNVLCFGSEKHFAIAFKAKVLLGTHDLENILPYKPASGFFHYENTYRVFLQHGVLGRKNVEYHKKYYELPFNLVIVSSEPEKYDIVMDELGYQEDEVAVTGLARFDNLIQNQNTRPKDILLMPTWRDWINTDQQFLESKYYAAYTNLINNTRLLELLEAYDVQLHFYPHYRAQDYFQREMRVDNDRVTFIPYDTYYVQELLINHALLITDFSSVSFDFSLMNKPVIYYHFDVKRFFRKGILRPVEETFIGKIAESEEELVNLIEDRLQHQLANYDVDISGIIKYQDASNCQRIFQTVESRLTQSQQ